MKSDKDDFGFDDIHTTDVIEPSSKNDRKWVKPVVYTLIGILLLAGVGVVVYAVFGNQHVSGRINDNSTVSNSIGTNSDDFGSTTSTESLSEILTNAGVPKFYQKAKASQTADDKKQSITYSLQYEPENASVALSSASASSATNSDGTLNKDYSYLNSTNVTTQVMDDVQRMINPEYGDWQYIAAQATYSDDNVKEVGQSFSDMFSAADSSTLSNNVDAKTLQSKLQLFADWNQNSYDNKELGVDPTYPVGVVNGQLSCDFNIQGMTDDSISCSIPVKYTFYYQDSNTTPYTVYKTLKLSYHPNYNDSQSNRVIMLDSMQQN